jgi:hypothetical protein
MYMYKLNNTYRNENSLEGTTEKNAWGHRSIDRQLTTTSGESTVQ